MTPKLQNGDYCFDDRGRLLEAQGGEALLEEALVRLLARKGRFPLNPGLGSGLFALDLNTADSPEAEALVAEALAPMAGVELIGVETDTSPSAGRLSLTVALRLNGKSETLSLFGAAKEAGPDGLILSERQSDSP